MSVLNNLFQEGESITEQPFIIPFVFSNKDSIPKGKDPGDKIIITPATVRTWFRLKPLLASIDRTDLTNLIQTDKKIVVPDAEIISIMDQYDETLMEIIFIGIHNKKGEMPEWFRDVLIDNCSWKDIHILFNAIIYRIGFQSFCKSITTAVSVSPMTEAEIIAARNNEESWTSR